MSKIKRLALVSALFMGLFVAAPTPTNAAVTYTWVTERYCVHNNPINTCYERQCYHARDGWTTLWYICGQWVKVTGLA